MTVLNTVCTLTIAELESGAAAEWEMGNDAEADELWQLASAYNATRLGHYYHRRYGYDVQYAPATSEELGPDDGGYPNPELYADTADWREEWDRHQARRIECAMLWL